MQQVHSLFAITIALYSAAAVFYLWSLVGGTTSICRLASLSAALGLAGNTAIIAVTAFATHRLPFPNLFGSLTFFAWALVAVYVLMSRKRRIEALGVYVSLAAVGLTAFASVVPHGTDVTPAPILQSHWSGIHIASCIIGYASLTIAFGAAVGYKLQKWLLKQKRLGTLQRRLPSLDTLDGIAYRMVSLGFPMLTLGIITGALWAQPAWGRFWGWDPKETWSLITWLVYAAYLHVRIVQKWRGKWANRLLVIGFACILVTYLGVNFLGTGLHKYNW